MELNVQNIKDFLKTSWAYLILVVTGLITLLTYLLNRKNSEITYLQSQLANITTQKQADVLEVQIKEKMDNVDLHQKDIDAHQKILDHLEIKRKEITKLQQGKTPQQIEQHWNA